MEPLNGHLQLVDDGWVSVEIDGAEARIDLYKVNNELVDIDRQHAQGGTVARHQAIVELLIRYGFPEVSHRTADRFYGAIVERVKRVQDFFSPNAGSPTATASTPLAPAP